MSEGREGHVSGEGDSDRDAAPVGDAAAATSDADEPSPADGPEPSFLRRIARTALAVVAILTVYFAFPVGDLPSGSDLLIPAVCLLVGLAALVYVAVRQLRVIAATSPGDPAVRIDVLVLVILIVVPLFALGYYAIEQGESGQFDDLDTKLDALYFALSTLATVGFGDVHATGQLARALVTVQMTFDLVFVAALVSILSSQVRARAVGRMATRPR